jgi:hypothetical protein
MSFRLVAIVALAFAALSANGCLMLAIPGLAYTGFQYEKTGKIPGMPSTKPESSSDQSSPSSRGTPSNSIE